MLDRVTLIGTRMLIETGSQLIIFADRGLAMESYPSAHALTVHVHEYQ